MIQFVANYDDLSTDKGFQFKFYCDKCGNGHMSEYMPSCSGTAANLLNTAGTFFGGLLGKVGEGAYEIQRAVGGKAHDEALRKAVTEAKKFFRQCTRCGKWVCPDVCWNPQASLCEACAPDAAEELAAQRAQATAEQISEKVRQQDLTAHLDMKHPAGLNVCPASGGKNSPQSQFGSGCGTALPERPAAVFCGHCGHKLTQEKFCPECGAPVAGRG
jgi:hypothetical protein